MNPMSVAVSLQGEHLSRAVNIATVPWLWSVTLV